MSWLADPLTRPRNWGSTADAWCGRPCLYRMYRADGRLLYIGMTTDLPTRMYMHKRGTPWFQDVARFVFRLYPSRRAVLDAERAAIKSEHPLHNIRSAVKPLDVAA